MTPGVRVMTKKTMVLFAAAILLLPSIMRPAPAGTGQEHTVKLRVAAEQANLRERPDIGSTIVQQVPEGTILEAEKKEGEWYLVHYTLEDGGVMAGYIHESLVAVVEPSTRPEQRKIPQPVPEPPRKPQPERVRTPEEGRASPFAWSEVGSRLEVSLSLRGGSVNPRDLNLAAQGLADYNAAELGIPADATVDALRLAAGLGVDVSYRLTPWLAVGVEVDWLRGSNGSSVLFSDETYSETYATTPRLKATPVSLGVRFYPAPGFYLKGSLGYYSVKAGYSYRFDQPDLRQVWEGSASGHCLGAEAGLGGDWFLSRRLRMFAEAGFRMARVERLSGSEAFTDSSGGLLATTGPLWYFLKQAEDGRAYPLLFIRDAIPAEEGVTEARRAEVNLSGMVFKLGIRFGF
jgi:hypothetical protein